MTSTRISQRVVMRLAVEADCSERTVRRRIRGERGWESVDERIDRAAEKIGVKLPKVRDSKQSAA